MNNVRDGKDNQEIGKPTETCKHRSLEMDESTGMWVCQDCWTTMTRTKYDNTKTTFSGS